ncbi:MAG: alpha/beta fold hydrolase [Actinomycetota bacterium]
MAPRAVASAFTVLALCLISGAGCGGSDNPVPDLSGSRVVGFRAPEASGDDAARTVRLEGRIFGAPGTVPRPGVVLVHTLPGDQRAWFDLAETLADEGALVLTFDLRGVCPGGDGGCSAGTQDPASAPTDLLAAIAFLRDEGASEVSVVGAGIGGTAALIAASTLESGADVPAIVTLSAPPQSGDLVVEDAMLQTQTAKLLIAGTGDEAAGEAAQELYGIATPPKRVEIVPSDGQGTELLESARGAEVERQIVLWLQQHASLPT